MNRVDLIKALVGRKVAGEGYRPRGMTRPGEMAAKPALARYRPGKGYFSSPAFQTIRDTRPEAFIYSKPRATEPVKAAEAFKERERHGAHALTRIAERLKRGWN